MNEAIHTSKPMSGPKTLVVGSGDCARRVAELLAEASIEVILAAPQKMLSNPPRTRSTELRDKGVELLAPARLVDCTGFVGDFEAVLDIDGTPVRKSVSTVVVAEDGGRRANFEPYGLNPGAGVWSLSDFKKHVQDTHHGASADFDGKTVVYLNGLAEENTPVIFGEILRNALTLQAMPDVRTLVLSVNLKVAGNGLEALYRQAKRAGTQFFKFKDALPRIRQLTDGRSDISFEDETTGYTYALQPDVTVVDERILPSDYATHLGRLLGLHTDGPGFLQTENVHRYSVATNRRGILVCGTSRGPLGPADIEADAAEAVVAVCDLNRSGSRTPPAKARIDTGQCIKCLTCYRLCPYRSIHKGLNMVVNVDACEGCGICAAECPRGAIDLGPDRGHAPIDTPHDLAKTLVAFCCSRSAARARELAECCRLELPQRLKIVEIPCAGALSVSHMLAPLSDGADGVLVMTCHEGNCHSETGNILARHRVDLLATQLEQMGPPAGRLEIHTLAANMANEFAQIVRGFDRKISASRVSGSSPKIQGAL